jgi:hypothetical protein
MPYKNIPQPEALHTPNLNSYSIDLLFENPLDNGIVNQTGILDKIRLLNKRRKCHLGSAYGVRISADYLVNEFKILNIISVETNLEHEERILIEEYKAILISVVKSHLQKTINHHNNADESTRTDKFNKYKQSGLWLIFAILMGFEFAPMVIGGLMYAKESLSTLIPYIPTVLASSNVMTLIGLGCIFNSIFGGICFVAPILMERLGIISQNKYKLLTKYYQIQIDGTEAINTIMSCNNDLTSKDYWFYAKITKALNQNIQLLNNYYPKVKESIFSRAFGIVMTILIGIQCVAGSLYMSGGVVGWWTASALTGTALATAMPFTIAAVAVLFFVPQLAINCILRTYSAKKMIDPAMEQFNEIKNRLQNFEPVTPKILDEIHNKKLSNEMNCQKIFAKKPLCTNQFEMDIESKRKFENDSSIDAQSIYSFWKTRVRIGSKPALLKSKPMDQERSCINMGLNC